MGKKIDKTFEIRNDDDGLLDEVVACHPRFFHLERMNDGAWWIGLEAGDGTSFHINLGSLNNKAQVLGYLEETGKIPDHHCVLCPQSKKK